MTKPATDKEKAAESKIDPPHVYTAINKITESLSKEGIGKHRQNEQPGSKYKFRGIDDVLNSLSPLLHSNNLVIIPNVLDRTMTVQKSNADKNLFFVVLKVEYDFISALDGTTHKAVVYGEAMDTSDKATNKALSAAYKILCLQAFCIPTEGDNDTENFTHEPVLSEPPRAGTVTTHAPAAQQSADLGVFKTREERTAWLGSAADQVKGYKAELDITKFQTVNEKFINSLAPNQKAALDGVIASRRAEIKATMDDDLPF